MLLTTDLVQDYGSIYSYIHVHSGVKQLACLPVSFFAIKKKLYSYS